ncbi:MAG: hypothetical protein JWN66_1874, partial [Sphingomonas bacterium]|nr:hypothetical protein [Sphingomonas bacterium]
MLLSALLMAMSAALPQAATAGAAADVTIEAPGPLGPLQGAMLNPPVTGGPAPMILIIPGSGPTN